MAEHQAGEPFGRYVLRELVGQGGFAEVWRAWDPNFQHEVALKRLLPHLVSVPDVRTRFLDEARRIFRLHQPRVHPHIVPVYDVGEVDGRPYYTMQFVTGRTLGQLLAERGPLPLAEVVPLVSTLAATLDDLHVAGIVHRDVKPANVMLDQSGRVLLMDFGIARVLSDPTRSVAGMVIGTPLYMAPEQLQGMAVTPATDIYALGALTYQLLAGRPPFTGNDPDLALAILSQMPPVLHQVRPNLPVSVSEAVQRALAKRPTDRPQRASLFAQALAAAAGPSSASGPTATPAPTALSNALTRIAAPTAELPVHITVTPAEVEMEAGGAAVELMITLENTGAIVDRYTVTIERLAGDWYTLRDESASLFPTDRAELRASLHPPRQQHVAAGRHPFVVRVRSQSNPTQSLTVPCLLTIRGFGDWTMDLTPQRIRGRAGQFRLLLATTGNQDLSVELSARDPELACTFVFATSRVTLQPGRPAAVELLVRPARRGTREEQAFDFTVTGQPVDSRPPRVVSGQLVYLPGPGWGWWLRAAGLAILAAGAVTAGTLLAISDSARDRVVDFARGETDPPSPITVTPTVGQTPTIAATALRTPTTTSTATPMITATLTRTPAPTPTLTPTATSTATPSPTLTATPTVTATVTASPTVTPTPTALVPPGTVRVRDTFTDSAGKLLQDHTGEVGGWSRHRAGTADAQISAGQQLRSAATGAQVALYASAVDPARAEYDVAVQLVVLTPNTSVAGVTARMADGTETFYVVQYNGAARAWELYRFVNGTQALLGRQPQTLSAGQTFSLVFEVRNGNKRVLINGVERIASADNTIVATGKAGVRLVGVQSNTTGYHLDNLVVTTR